MLCQFSVKNFKSIKEEITLDMQAASISEHPEHLLTDADGESFLPLAVIYGPNGGGKSNVLKALQFLCAKILFPFLVLQSNNSLESNLAKDTFITPFKFNEESRNSPTEFELFFRTKAAEYKYNMSICKNKILYESLYKKNINGTRKSLLFERSTGVKEPYKLSGSFKNLKLSDFDDTFPMLSNILIMNGKNPVVFDILIWMVKTGLMHDFDISAIYMSIYKEALEKEKELFKKILKELDIDIADYRIIEKDDKNFDIMTTHNIDGINFELELSEESGGTRKLFDVLPQILKSLAEGSILYVDELDAKLHPKLLQYIINLYSDPEINKNKAQLIFTSHDLSSMNSNIFRRDEIWFAAKNNEQATDLYSLVEFKDEDGKSIRKDARFDKQYLEGRYGADPYLKKIINWGESNK